MGWARLLMNWCSCEKWTIWPSLMTRSKWLRGEEEKWAWGERLTRVSGLLGRMEPVWHGHLVKVCTANKSTGEAVRSGELLRWCSQIGVPSTALSQLSAFLAAASVICLLSLSLSLSYSRSSSSRELKLSLSLSLSLVAAVVVSVADSPSPCSLLVSNHRQRVPLRLRLRLEGRRPAHTLQFNYHVCYVMVEASFTGQSHHRAHTWTRWSGRGAQCPLQMIITKWVQQEQLSCLLFVCFLRQKLGEKCSKKGDSGRGALGEWRYGMHSMHYWLKWQFLPVGALCFCGNPFSISITQTFAGWSAPNDTDRRSPGDAMLGAVHFTSLLENVLLAMTREQWLSFTVRQYPLGKLSLK